MDKSSLETSPRVIFMKAIENCKPSMGLVTIKRGGKNYQVLNLAFSLIPVSFLQAFTILKISLSCGNDGK